MSAFYGPTEHAVRSEVYRRFVETAKAPTLREIAEGTNLEEDRAGRALEALHDMRILVLRRGRRKIARALPFSASPTSHAVRTNGREYWANCAWDALGIPAALEKDAEIRSDGFAGSDTFHFEIRDGRLLGDEEVQVGFVVPARRWWDDIGFT